MYFPPLAKYGFLPWYKKGIGINIKETDKHSGSSPVTDPDERPTMDVTLSYQGKKGSVIQTGAITKNLLFQSPADVIGIDESMIVRTQPANGLNDFEPEFLPFIEFYEEDFLWRYTPARPDTDQKKLTPWLALIILKEHEFTLSPPDGLKTLPSIQITQPPFDPAFPPVVLSDIFHPANEHWAWGHVHMLQDIQQAGDPLSKTLEDYYAAIKENPDTAVCRLLCPRKLETNISYTAFLIPFYETGRKAGLGQDTSMTKSQDPAWGAGQTQYPIYKSWNFRTSDQGSFEDLILRLQPFSAANDLGSRPMDINKSGYGLNQFFDLTTDSASNPVGLEGALMPPGFEGIRKTWPDTIGNENYQEALVSLLNYESLLQENNPAGLTTIHQVLVNEGEAVFANAASSVNDPIIAPPIYGKWYAMVRKVDPENNLNQAAWLNELNTDPRYRAVAGAGTQVIRDFQEDFMEIAWKQIGEVNEANALIRKAELSRMASMTMFQKHVVSESNAQANLRITAALHKKVSIAGSSVQKMVNVSSTPNATFDSGFRKITRRNGVVHKRINQKRNPNALINLNDSIVENLNTGVIKAANDHKAPDDTEEILELNDFIIAHNASGIQVDPANGTIETEPNSGALVLNGSVTGSNLAQDINTEVSLVSGLLTTAVSGTTPTPLNLDIDDIAAGLLLKLEPGKNINSRVSAKLKIFSGNSYVNSAQANKPIMAYPVITEPMYEKLRDISSEFLLPNLDKYPYNSITILETNKKFIESYLVGLNHEMSRELLWREYPTDQRGSCFRQFWNILDSETASNELEDIDPIHEWGNNDLEDNHTSRHTDANQAVLFIRGDLLRKYPNTIIYAQKAIIDGSGNRTLASELEENIKFPIFKAEVDPDVVMLGFNLSTEDAKGLNGGAGWYFILRERPGQVNFGLDSTSPPPTLDSWDKLSWDHLTSNGLRLASQQLTLISPIDPADQSVSWASEAASMAYILYQSPVMVAYHASDMLANI